MVLQKSILRPDQMYVVTKAAIQVAKPKELAHDFRSRCEVAVLYSATKLVGLDLRDRSSQDVLTSI